MYNVRCQGWDHSKEYFTCATYRKQRGGCFSHQVRTEVVEKLLLQSLKELIRYASEYESEFVDMVLQKTQKARNAELRENKREYDQSKTRIAELDQIMQRLYEDNFWRTIQAAGFADRKIQCLIFPYIEFDEPFC